MGLFDSVMVPCPECGTINEFQSKGGDCRLAEYTLADAPSDVLIDAVGYTVTCTECGYPYHLEVNVSARAEGGPARREDRERRWSW